MHTNFIRTGSDIQKLIGGHAQTKRQHHSLMELSPS
jgi:hypothetical protein